VLAAYAAQRVAMGRPPADAVMVIWCVAPLYSWTVERRQLRAYLGIITELPTGGGVRGAYATTGGASNPFTDRDHAGTIGNR
jgi:hypothetical protein